MFTTRSGADRFHGSASDYFNYQKTFASQHFVGYPYQPFHSNNMDFAIGGPVIPHHNFYFVFAVEHRPADVICDQGGRPTPCSSAAAGSPVITPNVLAPDSGDYNLDGLNYDVPLDPSQNFTGSHSSSAFIHGLFTVADFAQAPQGTQGTERRNIYRNPGMFQADASVLKNNKLPWLGEQGNLQFRFDFLNVFNHGNLGNVDPNMADGTFGKVTSTLNPFDARKIDLGLRVSF